jgi:hypothetical protein
MARHYLYEAANVLLTTVKKRFALRGWGLRLMRRLGPKRARVAVARKLGSLGACVEGWHALRCGCRGMRREEAWR